MRKKQTFLLTIITPENESSSLCGRLKVISSGKTSTFTNLDELYQIITSEMGPEVMRILAEKTGREVYSEENDPSGAEPVQGPH